MKIESKTSYDPSTKDNLQMFSSFERYPEIVQIIDSMTVQILELLERDFTKVGDNPVMEEDDGDGVIEDMEADIDIEEFKREPADKETVDNDPVSTVQESQGTIDCVQEMKMNEIGNDCHNKSLLTFSS